MEEETSKGVKVNLKAVECDICGAKISVPQGTAIDEPRVLKSFFNEEYRFGLFASATTRITCERCHYLLNIQDKVKPK